jgi:hypothetical protein
MHPTKELMDHLRRVVQLTLISYRRSFLCVERSAANRAGRRRTMNIFKKSRMNYLARHDSLLHELALRTMGEHKPRSDDLYPHRRCQTCHQLWPCPGYQLAQTAEIQARRYRGKQA